MPLRQADRSAFVEMLTYVGALYGRDMSPGVIDLYWSALQQFDLSAVRQSLDRHVKSPDAGQFMPKPADLIRMMGGTSSDAAMQAWAKVERAIRTVGGHESVVFDDPLIHRAIDDMGGWIKLCEVLEDDLVFRARDFQALYRGFAMRREIPPYPRKLIGRFEAVNTQSGWPSQGVTYIGNKDACALVFQGGGGERLQITRGDSFSAPLDSAVKRLQ
jgi:hypothetical protein